MIKFIKDYNQDIIAKSFLVFMGAVMARVMPNAPLSAIGLGILCGMILLAVQNKIGLGASK